MARASQALVLGVAVLATLFSTTPSVAQSARQVWLGAGQVWHFSLGGTFPCDGCDAYNGWYYTDMAAAGATATSWNDIRQQKDWRDRVRRMGEQNRSRGVRTIGTISNVWFWH